MCGHVRQAHLPRRVATNVWKRKTSSLTKAAGKQCVDTEDKLTYQGRTKRDDQAKCSGAV